MAEATLRAPAVKPATHTASSAIMPLALAQFIASYAATNMNVAISSIANDLSTTVIGVQTAITLFTLVMAALMIPGSKLTDIWGRKYCFMLGLGIYGTGAVIAALAPALPVLTIGYSLFEGVGSALMIPPIYILVTTYFTELTERAKNFGIISAAAGLGAAAGPLIGGLITSAFSWRASFLVQALVVATIMFLSRNLSDPALEGKRQAFDFGGAVLSALGLVLIVVGILQASTYSWFKASQDFSLFGTVVIPAGGISPVWPFVFAGLLVLLWFVSHIRRREKSGRPPLVSIRILRNRISNLGLATQLDQWLIMQGTFFVVSVFLQTVRGFSAIQTGLILTPATAGILLSSAAAGRLSQRRAQSTLIRWGFLFTIIGMGLLLLLARADSGIWTYIPGLFAIGFGVGIMLTSSVNVVQSAFPEADQGEISGVSRSASNLGSSLGTALAGSVLVSTLLIGNAHFVLALVIMMLIAALGLIAALLIPSRAPEASPSVQ